MRLFCFALLLAFTTKLSAQNNLSGAYGYVLNAPSNAPATESGRGPAGTLVLLEMENNKYRFWLDITLGWPSYAVGETDGTITIINDTASFDNTFEDATYSCILKFKVNGNSISIASVSASFNCGFGAGVTADGDYKRLAAQPVLNNDWLKKEYQQSHTLEVIADKAELFQDENALRPFPKKQFFAKGDRLLNITETEKTIYTEWINPAGKLLYGWIKKSALKTIAGN